MEIELTKGKFSTVDDDDFEYLSQWKWHCNSNGYASRSTYYKKDCGKRSVKTIHMHRVVNETKDSLQTDHINGDKLDNRKENLRSCTNSQNQMNRRNDKNESSKFKGVYRYKDKWGARIKKDKKSKHLGFFKSEKEASVEYDKAAKEYFGEFARLNSSMWAND